MSVKIPAFKTNSSQSFRWRSQRNLISFHNSSFTKKRRKNYAVTKTNID
ncbi:MAG: hypothetical protein IPM56_15615 [Ignavibacteriales bacterium]|nr:MAG: hypothetical protein IPM56_15615 [Ignavibacteriales bacterium]